MTKRIADYNTIVKVLQNDSPSEINKKTGITRNSIYRYKNGEGQIENMPLGDAIKLTNYARLDDPDVDNTSTFLVANRTNTLDVGNGEQLVIAGSEEQFRLYYDVCVLWLMNNDEEPVRPIKNPVSGTNLISPEDCYEAERQLHARIDFYDIDPEYSGAARHYYNSLGESKK